MSIEKSAAWKTGSRPNRDQAKPEDETPPKGVRVLSLDIEDEDEDVGGDPYNRTGQLYVEALRKRDQSSD
jgi:hypothetical protein